jgi:hypothetical protein
MKAARAEGYLPGCRASDLSVLWERQAGSFGVAPKHLQSGANAIYPIPAIIFKASCQLAE